MRSLLVALLVVLPTASSAQLLRGRVEEAEATQPIRLVVLELLDDRERVLLQTTADSTGAFRVRAWQPGKYKLRASALGYTSVTSGLIELGTGDEVALRIELTPDAVPIQPITVVSRTRSSLTDIALRGYLDRRDSGRRIGIGRFLDRGEIEKLGTKLSDVLRRVPGLRIVPNGCGFPFVVSATAPLAARNPDTRSMPGRCGPPANVCIARLYLDGMPLDYQSGVPLDQVVPLDWVEAIEAYRRPAELPAEFLQDGVCGVVALWTRRG